jgi:uncharacterized C2H2 Zn-finger protein
LDREDYGKDEGRYMICPRCDFNQAYKIFEAPVDKCWEVYRCPRCNFTWRSTEEEEVTNPKLYHSKFKLSERQIEGMAPKPPIPPLRRPQEVKR